MQNIKCSRIIFFVIFIAALLFTCPQPVNAEGVSQWLYFVDSQIEEEDLVSHMEFFETKNMNVVYMIDVSLLYKKRTIYLLSEAQKNYDLQIAVSNVAKYDSFISRKEYYKDLKFNNIYEIDDEVIWFLTDSEVKFNLVNVTSDIVSLKESADKKDNCAYMIRSSQWNEAGILFLLDYSEIPSYQPDQSLYLDVYDEASSLRWFNTFGRGVLVFFSVCIVAFIISLSVFKIWSYRRLQKQKGSG